MKTIEKLVRRNILELLPYSSARSEFQGKDGVFLDANENPFGDLNRYPDPLQKKLKEKISKLKDISEDSIFIGNGSDEVIDLVFRIFGEPGIDKALAFTPTYGMYEVAAKINDVIFINSPLTDNFQINKTELEKYIQGANLKFIFICSPNNPTGNSINSEDIEFILTLFKGILVIDEAYIEFSTVASWLNKIKNYPNLIICQTLSKAWGLAGARIGMAFASPEIIRLFNKVKPPYNVSALNQAAALSALSNTSVFKKNQSAILSGRKRLGKELLRFYFIKKIYSSDANFLLVEVVDANQLYVDLLNKKIITRNRTQMLNNCIRITVGSAEENKKLITALNEIANEKSSFYRP